MNILSGFIVLNNLLVEINVKSEFTHAHNKFENPLLKFLKDVFFSLTLNN